MEPTRELIASIDRAKMEQARQMSDGERILAGAHIFNRVCRWARDGIRSQFPDADEAADFVLHADSASWSRFFQRLPRNVTLDPQMRLETITMTTRYDLAVNGTKFRIDLFNLSDDPHDRARFHRRIAKDVCGRPVPVPIPEDVVIQKIRWSKGGKRRKDIDDAVNVMAMQFAPLDWPYIEQWCEKHGTLALLNELREEVRNSGLI